MRFSDKTTRLTYQLHSLTLLVKLSKQHEDDVGKASMSVKTVVPGEKGIVCAVAKAFPIGREWSPQLGASHNETVINHSHDTLPQNKL